MDNFDKSFLKKSLKIYLIAVVLVVILFILKSIFFEEKKIELLKFDTVKQTPASIKIEDSNKTQRPKILLLEKK